MRHKEQSASAMVTETNPGLCQFEILFGDLRALLQRIGSPDASSNAFVPFQTDSANSLPALRGFLEDYVNRILPCELPAIVEAHGHVRRGQWRELVALDLRLKPVLERTGFAGPSSRVGQRQLARLRTLRDERTVQRYLAAVQSGQAHGWHTLVYGVTLAVFSLPLRQGLLHYAQETLTGLAAVASRSRDFDTGEVAEMLSQLSARLPEAVAAALQNEDLFKPVSMANEKAG